jgi:ATP-dependent Clp protease adapter protein ClpS
MSQPHADRPVGPPGPADPTHRVRAPGKPQSRDLPRYKLILLYDPVHDLMFVVRTVMELTRYCRAEATHKMWQSYHWGRSVLLVTYKERAELYQEQFATKGLTVTIEPA